MTRRANDGPAVDLAASIDPAPQGAPGMEGGSAASIDLADVQGLVRYGYARLTEASFHLLRIEDPVAARSWLLAAPVSSAAELPEPPETALQVAFTREGLQTLGVQARVVDGFSPEFISGMAGEESRSRRLGDLGESSPDRWRWGGPGNVPHLLVMLYAQEGRLEALEQTVRSDPWSAAFHLLARLTTSDLDGVEPFGFVDGISQPRVDWERRWRPDRRREGEYGNVAALGEFLLGYPNEYGKYTDRPLLDPADPHALELLPAEDDPGRRDLARHGTYLVFRQLHQDVQGFWRYVEEQAGSDAEERRRLAEAMVGRSMSGEPLIPATGRPVPGVGPDREDVRRNNFTYRSDPEGQRCPLGAHVRRSNPRVPDLPGADGLLSRLARTLGFGRSRARDDLVAASRFHRLLRRGREYGEGMSPQRAVAPERDDQERGLHFICLNASIARQFEFVQNAWLMGTKFGGLREEGDPLTGNREPLRGCPRTDTFTLARRNGVPRRIAGMPRFVTVRGGAYFFLPSLRALRYLAQVGA